MHQAGKKGMRKYPEGVRKSIRKELAVNYSSVFVRIFSGLCYLAQTGNICVFTFTFTPVGINGIFQEKHG